MIRDNSVKVLEAGDTAFCGGANFQKWIPAGRMLVLPLN